MADKKHKRALEKQSESLSQPCVITVYGEGAMPYRNPKNIVLEQQLPKNGSLFRVKIVFFAREKHIKFK